ncbi:hypothetical protein ACH5RR_009857 [Cinchona calisaya]|uniref:MaoC-like domain-containing protein n=1 Tax=Cinchona calisaya TaxID=153742 RepID=A0ABD3AI62_9GENT
MNCLRELLKIKHLVSNPIYSSAFLHSSSSTPNVLKNGHILKLARTFSDSDIADYSELSLDSNPLHFDSEYAKVAGFSDRLVPGMLVATLFPRIIASHFPGAIYVSQSLQFKLPVYIGEEITGEVEATNIKEMRKKYLVKFSTKCLKDSNIMVIDGEATAILPTLAMEQQ